MSRLLALLAIVPVVALATACGTPFIELSTDLGAGTDGDGPYAKVWQAMKATLQAEYGPQHVHESSYPGPDRHRLYVSSRVNGDMLSKTRVKVEAFVVRDEYNEPTPMFQAWMQMEAYPGEGGWSNSYEPWFMGGLSATKIWQNVGRNERIEARLTNATYERLEGFNPFGGRFMMDSKPWVEFVPVDPKPYDGSTQEPDVLPRDEDTE